jgi:hypothetical protein
MRLEVFHDRVQAHRGCGGREARVAGRVLDRHHAQAALLAVRVCLDYQADQPSPLVNHSRPREPLPQRGALRNAAADVERNKTVRITRPAGRKQPACHLLTVS